MSIQVEISKNHPMDELYYIVSYTSQLDFDLFSNPNILFILPDGISINNVKERVTEYYDPKENQKIEFLTFDQLANKIINTKKTRPEIVPTEIRRLFIVESIKELADNGYIIAENLWNLIKDSYVPENEDAIKSIDTEFDEFLRCVYPPQLEDGTEYHFTKMKNVLDKVEGKFYRKSSGDAIYFYKQLESSVRNKINYFLEDNYYLSRAHLVGTAAEYLKENESLLEELYPSIDKVWISGIPVFDAPVLELVYQIGCRKSLRINVGSLTADRLDKRLQNEWNLDTEIIEKTDSFNFDKCRYIELPDMRRETEYITHDIATKIIDENNRINSKNIAVFSRDSGQYMPYAENAVWDYGLTGYVQTRRNLALTPAFRLAASLFYLLSLIESDRKIKASDIIDPLRLGFVHKWGQRPLKDSNFLGLESYVGHLGSGKEYKWNDWKSKLAYVKNPRLRELIKWVDDNLQSPSCKPIESIMKLFEKGCSDWGKKYRPSNGFDQDDQLSTEHITSHASFIVSKLHRVERFADTCKNIQGNSDFKWSDLLRAFYGIAGSETYGIPNRDSQAIRFIDAGNAHFIDGDIRYILGLKSKGFPREYPSGVLLDDEYRKKINEGYNILYLRGPDTDYENEHDFFEAALGSNKNKEIIFTMPYLDDRGHKEEWSVFVNESNKKATHIKPSEFIVQDSEKISPKLHWRNASLLTRNNDSISYNYTKNIEPPWLANIADYEITPRLNTFECNVINRNPEIAIDESSENYLSSFINNLKNRKIPAHEINLYEECPLMYYFYKYLYCLGQYYAGYERGKREYIPEWKFDFKLGPIPLPVRRRHISSNMEDWLQYIINKANTSRKLSANRKEIVGEIFNAKNIDYLTKILLTKSVDYLINKNTDVIRFTERNETSGDTELYRPAYLTVDNKYIFLARTAPRSRNKNNIPVPHVLHKRHMKTVLTPGSNKSYNVLPNDEYKNLKQGIKSISYEVDGFDDERCKDCVYRTLCGDWGFY